MGLGPCQHRLRWSQRCSAALDVSHPTQQPELTFSGTLGEQVNAALTNVQMSVGNCYSLILVDPQGAALASNSSCNGDGSSLGLGPDTLNATGTWAILFRIADVTATGTSGASAASP